MPSTHSYIPQKYWMSFKRPHLSLSEYPCFTSLLGSLVYSFGIKRTGPANTVQLCCSIRCSLECMPNRAETAFVTLFRMCFNAMCSMCLTRWMAVTCHRPAWSFFVYVFMLFHISQWVHQGNALDIMGTLRSCHSLSFTSLSSYTTPFDSSMYRATCFITDVYLGRGEYLVKNPYAPSALGPDRKCVPACNSVT